MASESFRTGVRMPETSGMGVAGLAEEEEQKQKWYLQIRRLYNGHILCVGSLLTIGKSFQDDPRTQGVLKGSFADVSGRHFPCCQTAGSAQSFSQLRGFVCYF